jgi:hypothetical protein
MESLQSVGLANSSNLILDVSWKTFVESPAECWRIPFNEGREFIELDKVFGNMLVVVHLQDFKFHFSITNRIMGAKVDLELGNEGRVIGVP